MTTPTDPLYASQWHFDLIGDIETIWNDYSGVGVQVGIYDDGTDYNHQDLNDNYDPSLQVTDNFGAVVDPFPVAFVPGDFSVSDSHGTAVAGLIAAENNGIGGVGVAWGSSITTVNIFGAGVYGNVNGPTADFLDVASQATNFDISQNSWGASPRQTADSSLAGTGFAAQLEAVYAHDAATGRGGLGTIITQAAGNDGLDANRDGINASRFTITVGATEIDGTVASYSNFGASILVAAPAAAVTTDLSGAAGNNATDYLDTFNGTSAATPVVSGVVALMLEANPDLGWRDVQTILALSASHTGSAMGGPATGFEDGAWYVNAADNWNGGGLHVSTSYGYGMVNAYNAVRLAEVWLLFAPVPATSANEQMVSSNLAVLGGGPAGLAVPDNNPTGVSFTLTVADTIAIEHVALHLDLSSTYVGDLRITLTSPEGTEVVVVQQGGVGTNVNGEWIYGIDSLHGELSTGVWTVQVADMAGRDLSTLFTASLDVYGAPVNPNDAYHFSDEFQTMVALDASRATIADRNGGSDWLDFAMVAGDVTLDLNPGGSFAVGGVVWGSIDAGSAIEHAVTGDGNDSLVGNIDYNQLEGMRGNDTMFGGAGFDSLFGQAGNDWLEGNAGFDRLSGGDGNDVLVGGATLDLLNGGAGGDSFVYVSPSDSGTGRGRSDLIQGFEHGIDYIDLSWIDGNPFVAGDQAVSFIGAVGFSGLGVASVGQLRLMNLPGFSVVQIDTDGNGVANIQILATTAAALTPGDFIL